MTLLVTCKQEQPLRPFSIVMRTHPFLVTHATELKHSFKQHTGIALNLVLLPTQDYERHLIRFLAKQIDTPPALVESYNPAELFYLKTALPLNKILATWDRLSNNKSLSNFMQMRKDAHNVVYAFNIHYPNPLVLVARQDWLQEEGIPLPTTVQELVSAARTAVNRSRRQSPVYGYGWDGPLYHLFLKSSDGNLIAYNKQKKHYIPAVASSMARAELTTLASLYTSGALAPTQFHETDQHIGSDLFKNNALLFLLTNAQTAKELYHTMGASRVCVAGLPRGKVKPANGTTSAWCYTAPERDPKQIQAFLNWWYSPETFRMLQSSSDTPLIPQWLHYNRHATTTIDTGIIAQLNRIASYERMQNTTYYRLPEINEIINRHWQHAIMGSTAITDVIHAAITEIHAKHLLP